MANHKSSLKRIRQTEERRLHNRFYARAMRAAVRSFRELTSKADAEAKLSEMYKVIDRTAKRGIIHRNKAANLKSKLAHFAAKLA
ncbi:MAG: 30S ribosomal protein S20 [Bacteroidales bacterium]|nr:30S ribosomal protein S20 [Bacteroidales bacterium]